MEVQNGLYDTKRGRRAVGRDTSQGKLLFRRLRNATDRINTAFFVTKLK